MAESDALVELLGMLISDPRTGVLIALLAIAAISDYRSFRIPNLLTGGGIAFALAYSAAVAPFPHAAWWWAVSGMLLGFAAMLPLYALRAMGAGDVKLMAMVGAFLGPDGILPALLFSVITAGFFAFAFAAAKRVTLTMLVNTGELLRSMMWSAVAGGRLAVEPATIQSVGKLAYGISIAVGTMSYLVARQLGFA
jgi:prepilin peptidase CpaA